MDSNTTISNSTISGNEAGGAATTMIFSGRGGGITVIGGAMGTDPTVDTVLTIEDSTICDNTAETYGGGISVYRYAGVMAVEVELRNTIVAENLDRVAAARQLRRSIACDHLVVRLQPRRRCDLQPDRG